MSSNYEYLPVPNGLGRTNAYSFGGSKAGTDEPVPVLGMRVDGRGNVQVTFNGKKWVDSEEVNRSYGEWLVMGGGH